MKIKFVSILALSVLMGSCAYVNPYIQEFNIVSIPQEAQMSEQMHQQIAQEMKLIVDPAMSSRLNSMGARLVQQLPRRDFEYRFYVVDNAEPNAFTIPGARIYVHKGLLSFVSNDDELAGVLAHEIGHAYERHSAKTLSRAYGLQHLTAMLFKENSGQLRQMALGLAGGGILSSYGREDEREADDIGFYLLTRAGYDRDGLLAFLRKLERLGGGHPVPFLSTHPPTPERVARLEKLSSGSITTSGTYPQNALR